MRNSHSTLVPPHEPPTSPLKRLPSLDALRGFDASARTLSFTLAGKALNLTQSAISRQVQSLEEALGLRLFERFNRRLALTANGQAFHRTVESALAQLDRAARELTEHPHARPLTISTTVSFASLWLIPRLPRWRAQHPEIDVRLQANDNTVDLVREGIDLAIRYCRPADAPSGSVALSEEHVFPVAAPQLLRAPFHPLKSPDDLRHHVLLHLDMSNRQRSVLPELTWEQWFATLRLENFTPAGEIYFSQYDHLVRAALEGQGIALGRTLLLATELQQGILKPLFAKGKQKQMDSARRYFAITNPERMEHASSAKRIRQLIDWMAGETGVG